MKNFLVYLIFIFSGLFLALYFKNSNLSTGDNKPTLKVFGSSSFISQWGPGPWLKEKFEKTCDCHVEFNDSADSTILLQRLKSEGRNGGADVVLGFDQYDIDNATSGLEWRKIKTDDVNFEDSVREVLSRSHLVPYDWSLLSFIVRKSDFQSLPKSLDDLLDPKLKGQIVLEDPRTSSPGLQFLLWLIEIKGEAKAFEYLGKLNQQLHSYAPSWSSAYGLFQKAQVKMVYSYVTSSVYHLVEDKTTDVVALEMNEGHPAQYEFVGIPSTCKNCELADRFVALLLSKEGQKTIMEKNYMFPVVQGAREGTVFANIPTYKMTVMQVLPTMADRERILKKWSQLRRAE